MQTIIRNQVLTDVIIVGSGPTGLMAAALLTRCGIKVRILDKSEQQAHETRAFGVQAKSLELFLNMGLAQTIINRGLLATGAQVFIDGKQAAEFNFDDLGRQDTPYSFLLMVPQSDIEAILVEDLQRLGVTVDHNLEVIDIDQSAEGVFVKAKDIHSNQECEFYGYYLIGADGAHSIVRKKLGLSFEGAAYPTGFFLADCKIAWPFDYEHIKIFLRGCHLAVYLPLKGKDICRLITINTVDDPKTAASAEANTASPLTLEEVQQEFNAATGLNIKLYDPIWLSRYRIHHRGVNKYGIGRVFVAGDAAHIHSPAGGQGMNTGLQDAANLAWKIAVVLKGNGTTELLTSYHSERWPVGQKILHFTDKLFSVMSSQKNWIAWLRNKMVPLLATIISKSKHCRNRAFSFVSQLGIHYHDNPYLFDDLSSSTTRAWRQGLTPGHRASDATIARNFDMFNLIQGYCFHIVVLSKKPLTKEEIQQITTGLKTLPDLMGIAIKKHIVAHSLMGEDARLIQAESNQVFEIYGLSDKIQQAVFFIRPDGYIAYRSDRINFPNLKLFMQRFSPQAMDINQK